VDFPQIRGIDINPLLTTDRGVIALDARVEIDPARRDIPAPNPDLSIRPYPSHETCVVNVAAGCYRIRPIRPADADLYPRFFDRTDAEDMRMRFLGATRTISHETLLQLTQLDYDRQMAFVALDAQGELAAIVRYAADPDRKTAEFGIIVRSDLKGRGLGRTLMKTLIDYARREGLATLVGRVLRDNGVMLALCAELGFETVPGDEPGLVQVSLALPSRAGAP